MSEPNARGANFRIWALVDQITLNPGDPFIIDATWEYQGPAIECGLLVRTNVPGSSAASWFTYYTWQEDGSETWAARSQSREFTLDSTHPAGVFDVEIWIIDKHDYDQWWDQLTKLGKSRVMTVGGAPPNGNGNGPVPTDKMGGFSQVNTAGILNAMGLMGSRGWLLSEQANGLCDAAHSAYGIEIITRQDAPGHFIGDTLEQAYSQGWNLAQWTADRAGNADVLMGLNEPPRHIIGLDRGSQFGRQLVNSHELGFAQGCRNRGKGSSILALSIGVDEANNDAEFRDFIRDFAGCLATADYFNVHSYGDLNGYHELNSPTAEWFALRYKKYVRAASQLGIRIPPIVIGECGMMPGPWDLGKSQQDVCNDFRWFASQIEADPSVAWAAAWIVGGFDDWSQWELLGSTVPECIRR